MAEVAVDERRLLKTIRWWDGFVIGLANPGFLLIGLWGSIIALGGQVAIILWIISAIIGALQAYIYCEPAAMFPDKPGGLSVYAREGWRKHFSFAGPIAVFGYWFAWSSVLAIYGSLIGYLLLAEFGGDGYLATTIYEPPIIQPLGWAQLIGVMCIVLCWIFNIRGMRPAVGLSYVVGALMIIPILVIAIGGFLTGDFSNHEINSNFVAANVEFYGDSATFFNQFVMIMVWLYILGWSTYGPEAGATFAPEYKDTANDTRKALASVGALNVVLAFLLPIVVLGTIGYDGLFNDLTGVVWLTDVVNSIAGDTFGKFLVVCHLRRPIALDEHGHDGRIAGALRPLRGEDDDQAARRSEQAQRARPRHDGRHAPEYLPAPLLPEHLLHPRGGQSRVHALARDRPVRDSALAERPPQLATSDQAWKGVDVAGGALLRR